MITGKKSFFAGRLLERGYTFEEVRACIVSDDGVTVTVDELHPAYPRAPKASHSLPPMAPADHNPTGGAGSELKSLLRSLGIASSQNCSCNARAKQMDEWGPDECEKRLPEIVDWLREQAEARRLPFVRFAAEQAVRLAIRRARRRAKKAG